MTEEIKRILEYFKKDNCLVPFKTLYKDEVNDLLNYITNLQKEKDDYKQRNKKAVEYIENHTENIDRGTYYEDYVETYDLLNILEGGDE